MLVDVAKVIAPDLHAGQPKWCDNHENVAMLIRWLACKGVTNNWEPDDYAYLVEKPWKWQTEWDDMQAEFAAAEVADGA